MDDEYLYSSQILMTHKLSYLLCVILKYQTESCTLPLDCFTLFTLAPKEKKPLKKEQNLNQKFTFIVRSTHHIFQYS